MMQKVLISAALTMLVVAGSGCDRADEAERGGGEEVLRISDRADEVDLVLTTTSLYMGLSQRVLDEVRAEVGRDRADAQGTDLGDKLENFVQDTVETVIAYRIEYPLDEVQNVSYHDGEIRILVLDEKLVSFDDVEVDGRKALSNFAETDARRLIAEFENLKRL